MIYYGNLSETLITRRVGSGRSTEKVGNVRRRVPKANHALAAAELADGHFQPIKALPTIELKSAMVFHFWPFSTSSQITSESWFCCHWYSFRLISLSGFLRLLLPRL